MAPARVWVVLGEHCFSSNGEVAWIVGAYATEAAAERAAERERDAAEAEGSVVYGREGDAEWDVDFTVVETEVQVE